MTVPVTPGKNSDSFIPRRARRHPHANSAHGLWCSGLLRLPDWTDCGDRGEIFCNECAEVVRAVPAADLQRALDDMELQLEVATGLCEHCGSVNLFPGLSRVEAFVCHRCAKENG
jgi:hypothetical protein